MNKNDTFSNELLNAFIDNELSDEDKQEVYAALAQSESVRQRVADLRLSSDLMRMAYCNVKPSSRSEYRITRSRSLWRVAAVLVVGIITGWFAHPLITKTNHVMQELNQVEKPNINGTHKVLFHVSRNDPEAFSRILDYIEDLLSRKLNAGAAQAVRVVANGDGLFLLHASGSPFGERIRQLQKKYANLQFSGCNRTRQRHQKESGEKIELLPQVRIIDSGVIEVMRLQERGWSYIPI